MNKDVFKTFIFGLMLVLVLSVVGLFTLAVLEVNAPDALVALPAALLTFLGGLFIKNPLLGDDGKPLLAKKGEDNLALALSMDPAAKVTGVTTNLGGGVTRFYPASGLSHSVSSTSVAAPEEGTAETEGEKNKPPRGKNSPAPPPDVSWATSAKKPKEPKEPEPTTPKVAPQPVPHGRQRHAPVKPNQTRCRAYHVVNGMRERCTLALDDHNAEGVHCDGLGHRWGMNR